jgi:ribosomal protein L40E
MPRVTDEYQTAREQEETRLCPECRMPISVLATRCRHCGSEVARPRKKEASLTIQDLGGDQASTYRPSGNFLEAIEAFRAEVLQPELGQGKAGQGTPDLPPLDARSLDMMNAALGDVRTSAPPARAAHGIPPALLWALLGLVAIAALGLGVTMASSLMNQRVEETPPRVNEAPRMMLADAPALDVLREAKQSFDEYPSAGNRAILDEARQYVAAAVEGLLQALDWNRQLHEQASRLSQQALSVDPSDVLRQLRQRVLDELNAYNFVLQVDSDVRQVTFQHHDRTKPPEIVTEGEILAGRFQVEKITSNQVRLTDLKVTGPGGARTLLYWVRDGHLSGLR